jgi:hypothetical protein
VLRGESTNCTRTCIMLYEYKNDLMFDMKSLAKGICLATNIAGNEKEPKTSLHSYRSNRIVISDD